MQINQISTYNYNYNSRKQVNFKNVRSSLLMELKSTAMKEKSKAMSSHYISELEGCADDFAEYLERLCM